MDVNSKSQKNIEIIEAISKQYLNLEIYSKLQAYLLFKNLRNHKDISIFI